ncbi:MAG: hypothetical protein EP344_02295 [Bacteroidetes bacterium]|nr:MAG: hypothetical protein EP344_02295 [Bacteroidota bacterium]
MQSSLFLGYFLSCLLLLTGPPALQAQTVDLRKDIAFFQAKLPEFQTWLRQNHLDGVIYADSLSVAPTKVTLFLKAAYKGARVCDSLQCAWDRLEKSNYRHNGQFFRERLLHKWAFMAEVHEEQAEVVVRCHDPAHFIARINSVDGRIPVDGRSIRSGAVAEVRLPQSMQGVNIGDNKAVLPGKRVKEVCTKAKQYLVRYYKTKGTPILWQARIDDSYSTVDEFVLEVTHMSYEICPDGYFEYHRIYVNGAQNGDDVILSWEFQGKYGSGIIFPPRKNDYKDMDLRYKNNLEDYQKKLFKLLLDYLRR